MGKIDGFRPPEFPEEAQKMSQSIKDSTEAKKSEQARAHLDWSQPNVPGEVLSNLFNKILIAACANKLLG